MERAKTRATFASGPVTECVSIPCGMARAAASSERSRGRAGAQTSTPGSREARVVHRQHGALENAAPPTLRDLGIGPPRVGIEHGKDFQSVASMSEGVRGRLKRNYRYR